MKTDATWQLDVDMEKWVIGLRRWFHRYPELSFEERNTQKKVLEVLETIGIQGREIAGTGVLAEIKGAKPGKTIALRTDMDALKILEAETDLNRDYRSQNQGVMHACGHDGHMAMVLGAARALAAMRDRLAGNVRLVFQQAEEDFPGGAYKLIEEGGLQGVDAIACCHLHGSIELGKLSFRPGPFMAYARKFIARLIGRPGHHMCPQDNIDPVQMAARFVSTLQQDIKQSLDPKEVYVLGFGSSNSGAQFNQTPADATVIGSYRTFDRGVSDRVEQVMRRNLDGIMKGFAIPTVKDLPRYELEVEDGYPVLVNHPAFTKRAAEVLKRDFTVDDDADVNLGGEDFAYYLEKVPGMFIFLGSANPGRGITAVNHSDRFDIDEAALGVGVRVFVRLVTDFLGNPAAYTG